MIISTGEVCKHMDTILKTYENDYMASAYVYAFQMEDDENIIDYLSALADKIGLKNFIIRSDTMKFNMINPTYKDQAQFKYDIEQETLSHIKAITDRYSAHFLELRTCSPSIFMTNEFMEQYLKSIIQMNTDPESFSCKLALLDGPMYLYRTTYVSNMPQSYNYPAVAEAIDIAIQNYAKQIGVPVKELMRMPVLILGRSKFVGKAIGDYLSDMYDAPVMYTNRNTRMKDIQKLMSIARVVINTVPAAGYISEITYPTENRQLFIDIGGSYTMSGNIAEGIMVNKLSDHQNLDFIRAKGGIGPITLRILLMRAYTIKTKLEEIV